MAADPIVNVRPDQRDRAAVGLVCLHAHLFEQEKALAAIRADVATLNTSPFTCRKAGQSPFLRELIIPFGRSGYVGLFEIVDTIEVVACAVRHQLEDDYH